jgi:uncharacterized membrane protein HdeD (DUF308 family)
LKRPFAVTFLGCLFIGAGLMGLIYHLSDRPLEQGIVWISAIRLLAVIGGVLLLTGQGWARWLLLMWLAFHVVVSALHSYSEAAAHLVLLLVIAYFLLTPPAATYFKISLPE